MLISVNFEPEEVALLSVEVLTEFFSELLRSSRLGHHRVVIPRQIAVWVETQVPLSAIDRAHLTRLRSEYTQLAGLVSSARIFVQVVLGADLSIEEGGRVVRIGLEKLLSGQFLQRTVLLLENASSDGRMLQEILMHEAKRRSFGEFSFFVANGGGSGTAIELSRLAAEGYFLVCICDSDLLVPGGARSATCNKVMTEASKIAVPGVVAATPCREIENFLPIEVLEVLYGATRASACSSLKSVFANQKSVPSGDCVWLYLDLKLGIQKGKLRLVCNTPEKLAWASAKFGLVEDDLEDFVLEGLGESIVEDFLNSGVARAEFFKFTRSQYWSRYFENWVELLLWGVCSRKEVRAG